MNKSSLYGIETDADCRRMLDELLELNRAAQEQMTKETVGAIKDRLKNYHQMASSNRGQSQMSEIERSHFQHAVTEAYVKAPNLNSRQTWHEGLSNIEYYLNYYRPSPK
jgi:hypothetical protein